jgi:hypothetical protein
MGGDDTKYERHVELRRAKRERDVAALVRALDDPIEGPIAARYLGETDAAEGASALLEHASSHDPHMRAAVATALGRLGRQEAVPFLVSRYSSEATRWVKPWLLDAVLRLDPAAGKDVAEQALVMLRGACASLLRIWSQVALMPTESTC